MAEIPRRVTLRENGTYIWSAELDMESEKRNYRTGGKICIITAIVIFHVGTLASIITHNWKAFLYFAGFALTTVLITFGVVHGQESMGQRRCTYRLMYELIATGSGRRTALFEFKKAKVMIIGKRYIELQGRFGAFRAYVPEADFDFVRGYIQSRVPMECEIRYE